MGLCSFACTQPAWKQYGTVTNFTSWSFVSESYFWPVKVQYCIRGMTLCSAKMRLQSSVCKIFENRINQVMLKCSSRTCLEIDILLANILELKIILQNIWRRVVVNDLISISQSTIFLIMLLPKRFHQNCLPEMCYKKKDNY